MSYQTLRKEWAKRKFILPVLPENSSIAQRLFNQLEQLDRLQVENQKIRERLKGDAVERRGIINHELNQGYYLYQDRIAIKNHQQLLDNKNRIYTEATIFEEQTVALLKDDSLRKDIAREIEQLKEKENEKKANNEAANNQAITDELKKIADEITMLENFLKDIQEKESTSIKTIQDFAKQQVRDGLDPSDLVAALEEQDIVGYAEDKDRQIADPNASFTTSHTYLYNGKEYEANYEHTNNGTKSSVRLKHMIKNPFEQLFGFPGLTWLFRGERWGSAGRLARIKVDYDEYVKQGHDHSYDLSGYSDNSAQLAPADLKAVKVWKRKYVAEFMEHVFQQAEKETKVAESGLDNTFKYSFMRFDKAIATIEKDVPKEDRSSEYKRELKKLYFRNNRIKEENAKLITLEFNREKHLEEQKNTSEFDRAVLSKQSATQAKVLLEAAHDRLALALQAVPESYTTISALSSSVQELQIARREVQLALDNAQMAVTEANKEYERQILDFSPSHPILLALKFEIEQAKEKLSKLDKALIEFDKVTAKLNEALSLVAQDDITAAINLNQNSVAVLLPVIITNDDNVRELAVILVDEGNQEIGANRDVKIEGIITQIKANDKESINLVNQAIRLNPTKAMRVMNIAHEKLLDRTAPEIENRILDIFVTVNNANAGLVSLNQNTANAAATVFARDDNQASARAIVTHDAAIIKAAATVLVDNPHYANAARVLNANDVGRNELADNQQCLLAMLKESAAGQDVIAQNANAMLTVLRADKKKLANDENVCAEIVGASTAVAANVLMRDDEFAESAADILLASDKGINVIANSPGHFFDVIRHSSVAQRNVANDAASFKTLLLASEAGRKAMVSDVIKKKSINEVADLIVANKDLAEKFLLRSDKSINAALAAAAKTSSPLPEGFVNSLIANPQLMQALNVNERGDAEVDAVENPMQPNNNQAENIQRIWQERTSDFINRLDNEWKQDLLKSYIQADNYRPLVTAVLEADRKFPVPAGLDVEKVRGDGDCLYTAVGLRTDPSQDAQFLRNAVADYLNDHRDEYTDIVHGLVKEGQSFEDYVAGVRKPQGEWGDDLEISIMMKILKRPILVVNADDGQIKHLDTLTDYLDSDPIFVFYNGHNHYDALTPKAGLATRQIVDQIQHSAAVETEFGDKLVNSFLENANDADISALSEADRLKAVGIALNDNNIADKLDTVFIPKLRQELVRTAIQQDKTSCINRLRGNNPQPILREALTASLDQDVHFINLAQENAKLAVVTAILELKNAAIDVVGELKSATLADVVKDIFTRHDSTVANQLTGDPATPESLTTDLLHQAMATALRDNSAAVVTAIKNTNAGALTSALERSLANNAGAAFDVVTNEDPANTREQILAASLLATGVDGVKGGAINAVTADVARRAALMPVLALNDPAVQNEINRVLASQSPASIAANNAIEALALALNQNSEALKGIIAARPAATLAILNNTYDRLKHPQVPANELVDLVNKHPGSCAAIHRILGANPNPVTAAHIDQARKTDPTGAQTAIEVAIAVANPQFIAIAIDQHPDAKAAVSEQLQGAVDTIKSAKSEVPVGERSVNLSGKINALNDVVNSLSPKAEALFNQVIRGKGTLQRKAEGGLRISYTDGSLAVEMSDDEARTHLERALDIYTERFDKLRILNQERIDIANESKGNANSDLANLNKNNENAEDALIAAQELKEKIELIQVQLKDPNSPLGSLYAEPDLQEVENTEKAAKHEVDRLEKLNTEIRDNVLAENLAPPADPQEALVNDNQQVKDSDAELKKARENHKAAQAKVAECAQLITKLKGKANVLDERVKAIMEQEKAAKKCVDDFPAVIKARQEKVDRQNENKWSYQNKMKA